MLMVVLAVCSGAPPTVENPVVTVAPIGATPAQPTETPLPSATFTPEATSTATPTSIPPYDLAALTASIFPDPPGEPEPFQVITDESGA